MSRASNTDSNRRSSVVFSVVALCLLWPAAVPAQNAAWKPFQAFPVIFARYTGLNGYEDLVMASDLLGASEKVLAAEQTPPTLKQMRAVLEDPNVVRALVMIHAGLDKPIQSPRDPDKMDDQTTYPELAGFRRTARVLAMVEYTALADGRVSKAIETLRDGLRLGYAVQNGTVVSGLVGVGVDAVVLERFAQHFDQMALRDCMQITALAEEWLRLAPMTESVLALEQRSLHNIFDGIKSDAQRLRTLVQDKLPEDGPASEAELAAVELSQYVNSDDPGIGAMLDQALAQSDAAHRALLVEFRKPAWQRRPLPKSQLRATMANRLIGLLTPSYALVLDKFDIERAKMHLLGVHGLIRRFRWENNRLPDSLEEFKRPDLTTDPFTGASLIYKPKGAVYELNSAGAPTRTDDSTGAASGGAPITLPK